MKGISKTERNGTAYWYAHINSRRVYCGKDNEGKELAEAGRAKYEADRKARRITRTGIKAPKNELRTIRALIDWYMKEVPDVQDKKAYTRKVNAAAHLYEFFKKSRIEQAKTNDQGRYKQWRRGQGAQDGTIAYEIGLLRTMFKMAVENEQIPIDIVPTKFNTEADILSRRAIEDNEYKKLLKGADSNFKDVLIAYESAMRSGEIRSLKAKQVHLDVTAISNGKVESSDYINLGMFGSKTKIERIVPVSLQLKAVLIRRMKNLSLDGYVFTKANGKPYTKAEIVNKMRRLCDKVGVPYGDKTIDKDEGKRLGIVFHSFRVTRTTAWVKEGFSDEIIRKATGHHSLEAYRRYVDLDAQSVMRLVRNQKLVQNGIQSSIEPVSQEV